MVRKNIRFTPPTTKARYLSTAKAAREANSSEIKVVMDI
jgi:hypothetical protein